MYLQLRETDKLWILSWDRNAGPRDDNQQRIPDTRELNHRQKSYLSKMPTAYMSVVRWIRTPLTKQCHWVKAVRLTLCRITSGVASTFMILLCHVTQFSGFIYSSFRKVLCYFVILLSATLLGQWRQRYSGYHKVLALLRWGKRPPVANMAACCLTLHSAFRPKVELRYYNKPTFAFAKAFVTGITDSKSNLTVGSYTWCLRNICINIYQ
jgi:hypothetical protein